MYKIPESLYPSKFLSSFLQEKKVTRYSAFGNLGYSLLIGAISRKAAVMHKCWSSSQLFTWASFIHFWKAAAQQKKWDRKVPPLIWACTGHQWQLGVFRDPSNSFLVLRAGKKFSWSGFIILEFRHLHQELHLNSSSRLHLQWIKRNRCRED